MIIKLKQLLKEIKKEKFYSFDGAIGKILTDNPVNMYNSTSPMYFGASLKYLFPKEYPEGNFDPKKISKLCYEKNIIFIIQTKEWLYFFSYYDKEPTEKQFEFLRDYCKKGKLKMLRISVPKDLRTDPMYGGHNYGGRRGQTEPDRPHPFFNFKDINEIQGYDPEFELKGKVKHLETQLKDKFPQLEELEIFLRNTGDIYIRLIRVKKNERGNGIGEKVIRRIFQFADEHDLYITLHPNPEPKYKEKLLKFYKNLGFIENSGKNVLYQFSSPITSTMYRPPKNKDKHIKPFFSSLQQESKDFSGIDLSKYIDENRLYNNDRYLDEVAEKLGYDLDFNKLFWYRPSILYHCTDEKKYEMIKKDNMLKTMNSSRGLSNKHIRKCIFTTQEELEISFFSHYYGKIVIEINTPQMKKDGYTPEVEQEPDWDRAQKLSYVLEKLHNDESGKYEAAKFIENSDQNSQGTVIVYGDMPIKYLSLYEGSYD